MSDPDYQPTKASADDDPYTYEFKCWNTKSGTTLTPWSPEQEVTSPLVLVPDWTKKAKPQPASLKVYHILNNADHPIDKTETSNDLSDYDLSDYVLGTDYFIQTISDLTEGLSEKVNAWTETDNSAMKGYYPNYIKRTCLLEAGENVLVFLYNIPETWYYQVEYCIRYTSVDPLPGWTYVSGIASAGQSTDVSLSTTEVEETTEEFILIGYEPSDDTAWMEQYKLYGFQYGDEEPTTDPYLLIERVSGTKSTMPAKVKVILVPDENTIEPEDRVVTYNGKPQGDADKEYLTYLQSDGSKAPIWFDPSVKHTSVKIHYLYYDMTNPDLAEKLENTEVVDAGTYGVRAYITVTNDDGTFLIWHSSDENSKPPLHLYIEKRIAFLSSASKSEPAPTILRGEEYPVYFTADSDARIRNMINTLALGGISTSDIGFVYLEEDDGSVVDDRPQKSDYIFAASSFRQMEGTSPNIFSFKPADAARKEKYRKNYNIYYFYGELTVTP